ncbi:MAG TPA: sugar phosphate isomerase/epimerase [Pirellulales bacterium]
MKFGMNLLLWTGDVTEQHYPILEKLKTMGYDGVEVPVFDLNPEKFAKLGKTLSDLGLERTAVTVRTLDDNPISPDAATRKKGLELNKLALDCCQALGAPLIVGPYHSALGHFSGTGPTEQEIAWAVEGIRGMAEHGEKVGVTLGVEYLNRFECYLLNTAAQAVNLVKQVNHPRCQTMYDTFHANIEEKDLAEAIKTCAPHMAHVHISENDRSTPGVGHVAWDVTFDALKAVGYDGWMTVEAFGLALPELAAATKIWRRMYADEFQLSAAALKFMKDEWAKRQ